MSSTRAAAFRSRTCGLCHPLFARTNRWAWSRCAREASLSHVEPIYNIFAALVSGVLPNEAGGSVFLSAVLGR
jgi:hypothetical protein